MGAEVIPAGSSTLQANLDGVIFTVFAHRPVRHLSGYLFVFHGQSRNAYDYRDFAIDLAETHGLVVIVPHFDKVRFSNNSYQRGNITDGRAEVKSAAEWSTRFVPLLIEWVKMDASLPYWLWGFSAGGQFLSRVAAFQNVGTPQRIVIASPSSHVLPLLGCWPDGEAAPFGLGRVFPLSEERARQHNYLAQPITLYVGAKDSEPDDTSLSRSSAAVRQGEDRVARACNTFDLGVAITLQEGWTFGWHLVIEPEVGHSASDLLAPNRAADMLGLIG